MNTSIAFQHGVDSYNSDNPSRSPFSGPLGEWLDRNPAPVGTHTHLMKAYLRGFEYAADQAAAAVLAG